MIIDLSVNVTREMIEEAKGFVSKDRILSELDLFGHLGTHFDIMGGTFDMDNLERAGRVFDVSAINGKEIGLTDVDLDNVSKGDFVMFHTGTIREKRYGTKDYVISQPELSWELIKTLTDIGVSMIGIDAGGLRLPADHAKVDKYCADRNVFVVENLYNLDTLLGAVGSGSFNVGTYPMNLSGATGLPCRIIARPM
ncbi:MAG: cyclase family protein [Synergistaceae bacterium]|jgi:kynurenine formamidase|nr:cyclase family protein [Synergistaceae bacterium]